MSKVYLKVNRKIGTPGSFKGPVLIQYVKNKQKVTLSQAFNSVFEEDAQTAYEIAAAYPGTITISEHPFAAPAEAPEAPGSAVEKALEKSPVNKMLKPEATK